MASPKPESVRAIELAQKTLESVYGNFGLLRFSIEQLIPTNGHGGAESKKWDIVCSFYESFRSPAPSRYRISVDLNDETVRLNKVEDVKEPKKEESGTSGASQG